MSFAPVVRWLKGLWLSLLVLGLLAGSVIVSASSASGASYYGDGRPDKSDTGVPHGTKLRRSGSITVTQDGAVIEGLDVDGTITVKADNVTIRNTRVSAGDPKTNNKEITYMGDATRLIFTESGTSNTLIDHVELDGRGDSRTMGLVGRVSDGAQQRHPRDRGRDQAWCAVGV